MRSTRYHSEGTVSLTGVRLRSCCKRIFFVVYFYWLFVPTIHPQESPLRPSTYAYLRVTNSYGESYYIYLPSLPFFPPYASLPMYLDTLAQPVLPDSARYTRTFIHPIA